MATAYRDPDTGIIHELDRVQRELYREFVEVDGLLPSTAAMLAFHVDSEDPATRVVDWSRVFAGAREFSQLAGRHRGWVSEAAGDAGLPLYQPVIIEHQGQRTLRLWTRARARLIAARNGRGTRQ